jgi:acetyl esterase/lipase
MLVSDQPVGDGIAVYRQLRYGTTDGVGDRDGGVGPMDPTIDVHGPDASGPWPVLVTIHGCCGAKEDLTQFAYAVARQGAVVFNAGWRGARPRGKYAQGADDIARAIHFARNRAADHRGDARRITLVAWSDGALPAAKAALDPPGGSGAGPDAFVGLGGYYGWADAAVPDAAVNDRTVAFLGGSPDQVPDRWRDANPYTHVGRRPEMPVTLVVGDADVQKVDAQRFQAALTAAGHTVDLLVVPAAGHFEIVIPRLPAGRTVVEAVLGVAKNARVIRGTIEP